MSFKGKIILVTDAASGIGAEFSCHLANSGASVSIVNRNAERRFETAAKIRKTLPSAPLPIVADLSKDTQRIGDTAKTVLLTAHIIFYQIK